MRKFLKLIITGFVILFLCFSYTSESTVAQAYESTTIFIPMIAQRSIYDPLIDNYIQTINMNRIQEKTEYLVTNFSPRSNEFYQVYIDQECTLGEFVYKDNNLMRTLTELTSIFSQMGYSIKTETVPEKYGGGYNIIAMNPPVDSSKNRKVIDIGAHIDAWKSWDSNISTPGASDNAVSVACLIEMANLLIDYPNQHPWQFVVFVSEERGRYGSKIHVESITPQYFKTALILDGIGWSEIFPDKMNCIWAYDDIPETVATAELFNKVKDTYHIPISWRRCETSMQTSDHQSYHEKNLPAVLSIGGLPYGGINYHTCNDNIPNMDMQNAYYTLQQNVAVLLTIDKEP